MAKSKALMQVQFTLRKDQTLDAVVGVAPETTVLKQINWVTALALLQRVEPAHAKKPQLHLVKTPPAEPKPPRARWAWAQPLVTVLCGGAK